MAEEELSEPIVVVAGPIGSGLTTAILQEHRSCYATGIELTLRDWFVMCERLTSQDELLVDDSCGLSDLLLRKLTESSAPFKIIFRTGPRVPDALANYPRVTLTQYNAA